MSRGYYTPPKHYDSQNYIWSNKDQLGSGAGGTVYVGYCKKDGMKVAVKEFKQSNYITVHQQEIEVLKALPTHRNIVRLFAAENESVKHHPVLVMELCTGKSLYEVIESPQNAYGLCEEEFKTMMIDTTEGLAHLRRHNVIHRDIKPGNIMRCRNHDGSYTYKLTDFGAARELAEGDRFVSLYGTEEYLHPDVYEKALVNTGKKAQFTAKVDLWSIGATLYHAATGRLPFQSYNQRKDRHTMFQIISRKDKGIISGVQRTSQGQIDWSSHLPEDTRISKGLKLLLEPILQGVLETDVSYMMDFDHYFERVKSIGRMKVFDVFVVSKCECIKVYIHPRDQRPYASLKRSVCEQCGIKDERYMDLYFDNLPLAVVDQTSVEKLPQTTEDRPIFVYGGQVEEHLKSIAMRQVPRQPDPKDLKQAIQFAKECHKLIYYQKHVTTMLNRKFAMMHQAASCMSHMLKKDQEMMSTLFQNVSTAYSSIRTQLFHFIGSLWQLRELLTAVNPQVQGSLTDFIQNIAEDKQSKEREVKLLEERYEPVSMKVQSIQELARRGISDDWDPNYLSESFAKRSAQLSWFEHTRTVPLCGGMCVQFFFYTSGCLYSSLRLLAPQNK
jgi:TANK-binding kinase 1